MGEGGGVGEDVVEDRPLALVLVGARLESGGAVDEVVGAGEEAELGRVGFGIEVAHDDDVGVVAVLAHRVGVCLQLLAEVHAEPMTLAAAFLRWQMHHIDIERVAAGKGASHMEDVACLLLGKAVSDALILKGVEGERGVE